MRIGTDNGEAGRSLPEVDVLGRSYRQIGIELAVGNNHFVVVPPAAAQHLIDQAVAEVKAAVKEFYEPEAHAPAAEAEAPSKSVTDEPPARTRRSGNN